MATVHIGLTYPDLIAHIAPGDLAERAERWGFHTLWVTDHALTPRLDPLVLLAAMSQRTRRLCLGTGVLAVPYRSPYLTAKAVASLDVLSGGRVTLGLGIGDLFHEFEALELDRRVRGRLSDERLAIIRRLLTEERVSFAGRFHRVADLRLLPRPVQQPHIPLWLGGHWDGGFVAPVLHRVARFADVFFPTWTPVEGYREGSPGRDPASRGGAGPRPGHHRLGGADLDLRRGQHGPGAPYGDPGHAGALRARRGGRRPEYRVGVCRRLHRNAGALQRARHHGVQPECGVPRARDGRAV